MDRLALMEYRWFAIDEAGRLNAEAVAEAAREGFRIIQAVSLQTKHVLVIMERPSRAQFKLESKLGQAESNDADPSAP